MTDSLPSAWLPDAPEVSLSGADVWWASHRERLRKNCADKASRDPLIALLKVPWFLHARCYIKVHECYTRLSHTGLCCYFLHSFIHLLLSDSVRHFIPCVYTPLPILNITDLSTFSQKECDSPFFAGALCFTNPFFFFFRFFTLFRRALKPFSTANFGLVFRIPIAEPHADGDVAVQTHS